MSMLNLYYEMWTGDSTVLLVAGVVMIVVAVRERLL